ncbi:unnamed protein product [Musa hybrid cultivar]
MKPTACSEALRLRCSCSLALSAPGLVGTSSPRSSRPRANRHSGCCRDEPEEQSLTHSRSSSSVGLDNDPSAGSPTETLLRLLLPLNDKVQWTSRDVAGGEPPPSPRSEHFTGPFNR